MIEEVKAGKTLMFGNGGGVDSCRWFRFPIVMVLMANRRRKRDDFSCLRKKLGT